MKKHVLFYCALAFICVCSVAVFCLIIPYCKEHWENVKLATEFGSEMLNFYRNKAVIGTILAVLCGISMLLSFSLFLYMSPRLFRHSTYKNIADKVSEEWAKNKSERAARKQAKSETDKQKRIETLQTERDKLNAELDELNANDNEQN